ncbi:MAG: AMP-binding protein [Actinomycetota bacterium]
MREDIRPLERILVLNENGSLVDGDVDLDAAMSGASTDFPMVDTAADDPAQLYYSSGTTGQAKGILHAHRYLLAHNEFELCHDVRADEIFHSTGEWAWIAGIVPGLLGPWRFGVPVAVLQRQGAYDPQQTFYVLEKYRVGNMFTTPTALRAMTEVKDPGAQYNVKLRICCSAGEPLNPEVISWFKSQFGIPVFDYYGLTESYPICGNYPTVEIRPGSMGKPLPGWEMSLLDPVSEEPVPDGEAGEICLKARSNRTTLWGTGTGRRTPRRCSVASGSTRKTWPAATPTATSGTRVAPTTSSSRPVTASVRSRLSRRSSSCPRSWKPPRSRHPIPNGGMS